VEIKKVESLPSEATKRERLAEDITHLVEPGSAVLTDNMRAALARGIEEGFCKRCIKYIKGCTPGEVILCTTRIIDFLDEELGGQTK
jgi:hypothetical protein